MLVQNLPLTAAGLPGIATEKSEPDKEDVQSLLQDGEGKTQSLSSLAQFAYSYQLSELEINANQTSFAYYKDDMSMAMRATSTFNARLSEEKISLNFTFSGEVLGLTAKDFEANGGKPIEIRFSATHIQQQITQKSYTRVQKTIRPPEDVMMDLAKALGKVMRDPGNKTVKYQFDEEAIRSLAGSDEVVRLLAELVMLMAAINMARKSGPRHDYTIYVSGKGKPFLEQQTETNLESHKTTIDYSITIQPPAAVQSEQVKAVEAAVETETPQVNVSA